MHKRVGSNIMLLQGTRIAEWLSVLGIITAAAIAIS
jgi:hypothetical protein